MSESKYHMKLINNISKWQLFLLAMCASFGWFIPKYLVILIYEAIRNF